MKKIIENWYHKPGRHCASTAIRDAMRYWGMDWSEALCFGLGRGLGGFYISNPNMTPSRMLMTRCADLEKKFFESLGIPFELKQASNDAEAHKVTKGFIDDGVPPLLHTDIFHLKYYNSKTHFNRHAVLMWGYDEDKGIGYLSDTQFEGLVEEPLESLLKARSSSYQPGPVKYDFYPIQKPPDSIDMESAVIEATRVQAFELLGPPPDFPFKLGLNALSELARDLPSLGDAADWQWCARFAYQVIEKRGTGGSGFRKIYAEFLDQVEEIDPGLKKLDLSVKMKNIAGKWSALADILKEISEMTEPQRLGEAAQLAETIHDLESDYCRTVLQNIPAPD